MNRPIKDILENDFNREAVANLLKQLESGSGVLPFVGAGLCVPLGFPGWTTFLIQQADICDSRDVVERHIGAGEFEEAAELISQRQGFGDFEDHLNQAFGENKLLREMPWDSALTQICRLTSGPVITTNFDRAIETMFNAANWPFSDRVWGPGADLLTLALAGDRHILLKMHGDVLERRDRILTLTEYRKHYGEGSEIDFNRPLPQSLRRVFENQRQPVLFVGCSLQYDRTMRVLKDVALRTNARHYALVETPKDESQRMKRRRDLSDHGLRTIWFPHGRFDLIEPLLRFFADRRPQSEVDPNGASRPHSRREITEDLPPTPIEDYWATKAWDHVVHEHLEEKLRYYLVRVRPYDRARTIEALEAFVQTEELGTVRAFELFGTYDLLIRAWLPARYPDDFESVLRRFVSQCQKVLPFTATEVVYRWNRPNPGDQNSRMRPQLLAQLDQQKIEAVQRGLESDLYRSLSDSGLVFDRAPLRPSTIIFFITLNIRADLTFEAQAAVQRTLLEYLTGHTGLERLAIDRGYGICQWLIKAETKDYFAIDEIPDWISDTFKAGQAETETFLSKAPVHISGGGRIGAATFKAMHGRDPFVSDIVPAVYALQSARKDEVENFVKNHQMLRTLGSGGRRLVREYLTGVLNSDEGETAAVLFRLFYGWEGYLRRVHRSFLGKRGLNPNTLYREAKIPDKPWADLTLVDVLQIFSHALRDTEAGKQVGTDWSELTKTRNAAMHHRKEVSDWKWMLNTVLSHWKRTNLLIRLVEKKTEEPFDGTYRDDSDLISGN